MTPQALVFAPLHHRDAAASYWARCSAWPGRRRRAAHLFGDEPARPPRAGAAGARAAATASLRYDLALPVPPTSGPRPVPGINLSTDSDPRLRDAFALEGVAEQEALANAVRVPDFNGDRNDELLVSGDAGSYLLFGPVQVSEVGDVVEEADVLIDAEVGRAASRMGDINGDGLADLVFVRPGNTTSQSVLTIIFGGLAEVELPRHVTLDWVNQTVAASGQNRVRTLTINDADFADADASIAVLNWDDDGFADVLLAQSLTISGSPAGSRGVASSARAVRPGTVGRRGRQRELQRARIAAPRLHPAYRTGRRPAERRRHGPYGQLRGAAAAAGDRRRRYRRRRLDDLLVADSGFIAFGGGGGGGGEGTFQSAVANVGRVYL